MRWLGLTDDNGEFRLSKPGVLLTYEQAAKILNGSCFQNFHLIKVAVDEDDNKFHLSIEEYLHSLISLINELVFV